MGKRVGEGWIGSLDLADVSRSDAAAAAATIIYRTDKQVLLYSTRTYIQYPVPIWNGIFKEHIYMFQRMCL